MSIVKEALRETLIFLHLDLTKNLKYDRLTRKIMRSTLRTGYNCIDIGCHKGEMLRAMINYSPNGHHYAFEPIPAMYSSLESKYGGKAKIFPYALSDKDGETSFQLVKNAPAYSGIKQRRYDIENPDIEEIKVEMRILDGVIPSDEKIHFIKIDVEGGEFGVLKGAKELLKTNKPIVLFECGKGASDYYGTAPGDLYNFLSDEIDLDLYTLQAYAKNEVPMDSEEFAGYFDSNEEYYFIAGPKNAQ